MPTLKYTSYGTAVTALSTELSGLADGGWAVGPLLNNTTNLDLYAVLDIVLSAGVTVGANDPRLDLYILPAPDGTNSPVPPGTTSGAIPISYRIGAIAANPSASFTRGNLRQAIILPGYFRIGLQNNLGVALPASGNVLSMYPYSEQSV